MVDSCEWGEVDPDMVADVHGPKMAYIPRNMIDEIVADDARFLPDDKMANFLPLLKVGGKIIFQPGSGLGWPAINPSGNDVKISDSGRHAQAPLAFINKVREKGTPERAQFIKDAMEKANAFYKNIGFSFVSFDDDHTVFILTK